MNVVRQKLLTTSRGTTFTMQTEKQKMIAALVKEKRVGLNYTQQQLADMCKVSLRSIQRIENGEVYPRQYTLNELAKNLGFTMESLETNSASTSLPKKEKLVRKWIMTATLTVVFFLLSTAYLAQASTFPETQFELIIYYAVVLIFLSSTLLFIWRNK